MVPQHETRANVIHEEVASREGVHGLNVDWFSQLNARHGFSRQGGNNGAMREGC